MSDSFKLRFETAETPADAVAPEGMPSNVVPDRVAVALSGYKINKNIGNAHYDGFVLIGLDLLNYGVYINDYTIQEWAVESIVDPDLPGGDQMPVYFIGFKGQPK